MPFVDEQITSPGVPPCGAHTELADKAARFPVGEGTADEVKATEEKKDGENGCNADGHEAGQWRPEVEMPCPHGEKDRQAPSEEPAKQGEWAKDSVNRDWRHDGSGKVRGTFRLGKATDVYSPVPSATGDVRQPFFVLSSRKEIIVYRCGTGALA